MADACTRSFCAILPPSLMLVLMLVMMVVMTLDGGCVWMEAFPSLCAALSFSLSLSLSFSLSLLWCPQARVLMVALCRAELWCLVARVVLWVRLKSISLD